MDASQKSLTSRPQCDRDHVIFPAAGAAGSGSDPLRSGADGSDTAAPACVADGQPVFHAGLMLQAQGQQLRRAKCAAESQRGHQCAALLLQSRLLEARRLLY